jgi:coenzyme F420-reducing hydrogenase delta subunit
MAEEAELKEFGVQDQDDYVAALNATMKDFGIKPPIHSHKFNSPAEKEKFDKAVDKKYAEISK